MKSSVLEFQRPAGLEAARPAEQRGLDRDEVRLLVSTDQGHRHGRFRDLPDFLPPGTLLVVNRSATLAASLPAERFEAGASGRFLLNLATPYGGDLWLAEPRRSAAEPGPVGLEAGERFRAAGLDARLVSFHPQLPRLAFVELSGDLERARERFGRPIRYGYVEAPFPSLEDYQTVFAREPGSAEMPSAGRPFTRRVLEALEERGIGVAQITLHTGVSSLEVETEAVEDHPLPPEPFEVSRSTAQAVEAARREGRPVVAVGTTVIRALESAWDGCRVRPARGFTRIFLHPPEPLHVVDGLISGFHDPRASHLAMLYALASPELIRDAYREAVSARYLWHEFGDSHLILPKAA